MKEKEVEMCNKKHLTLGSLFDGSGGFPLGGKLAGIETLWASEIEPFPIAVTRKRFPNVKHYGDISKINGAEVEPVDIITFGSPCFPAGTFVTTNKGEIPIEHVSIGMFVLTHNGRFRKVTATGAKEAETIILRDEHEHTLECTPNHPIYSTENPTDIRICEIGREWIQAKDMLGKFWSRPVIFTNPVQNDDRLYFDEHRWSRVSSISLGKTKTIVYNLTVEEDNSYVADGVVVHNCQDLSLAGKRKGLVDGDRSSLFFQAIRLIKEMRNATRIETNGLDNRPTSPRFIVWENVFGAFSSNKGEDFKKVLEEICKVKDESVTIPKPKKWNNAGCIMGNGYSIAWRTFDAQYWGVPQRRRRIYLVADFDGECAGDILFKSEGLSRNSMESRKPWERTSKNSQDCIGAAGFDGYNGCVTGEKSSTLGVNCGMSTGRNGVIQAFGICSKESNSMKSDNPNSGFYKAEISKTLDLNGANPTCNQGEIAVVENNCKETPNDVSYGIERAAFNQGKNAKFDFSIEEELSPTIISKGPNAVALSKIHATLSYADGSKGVYSQMLINPEENFVLERQVSNKQQNDKKDANVLTSSGLSFFTEVSEDVAYTLASRDYKDPPICCSPEEHYIIRRLTPTECARLQGFYDWWCDDIAVENPTEEDMEFWRNVFETHRKIVSSTSRPKSDRQIKKWLANPRSDSSEYKMWGNGVALPNVYFVMNGIVEAYKNKSSNNQKV